MSDDASNGVADRLAQAFAAMTDGVIVADRKTGHVIMNPAARKLLGLDADAAITTTFLKERLGFYPFDLVAAGAGEVREEVHIGGRHLSSAVSALRGDDGESIGAVVVLREPPPSFDDARRRAEVASMVSHDLRTPLTSIAGALDIVLSGYAGTLADKQHRYVEMARHAATRMNALLDELLDASRARSGTITVSPIAIDLATLTGDVVTRYADVARAKRITIAVKASANAIPIQGDPDRLAQVLGNLLTNSIKFAPADGTIDVEVFGPPVVADAVGVSVFNAGEPIPEEERERIFEPFAQAGRRVGGTGLGLGISRAIVEAHGGRIWVESGADGTKFVFTLPAAAAPAAVSAEVRRPPRRLPTGESARVLVVDNDRHRAYLLKGLLMAAGHHVQVADDADAALAQARSERPTLAVISAQVPDAASLLATIEHDPDTRKCAVVALGEPGQAQELLAAGADEFVELPLQPQVLRDTCQRLLIEGARREAPRVLVVDDDASIRAICREVLEHAGYTVREVASSDGAVSEARRFRPDLVLLDVMMPIIDGFRTAERLRADAATGLTPIIFLSAKGDTADKVRAFRSGAEDYVVKPFDAAELVARVGKALDRQARELGASPTTQLPGADAIEAEIERRLAEGDKGAVCCYLDLDNLKAFNDYYGYAKADGVIRQTGDLIRDVVSKCGATGDFIGHIAGDDFVFVTQAARVDDVCRTICNRFDQLIPLYYNREDRARGFIETKDRWGVMRKFPIMSVSIAGVSVATVGTFSDLATAAAAGKKLAKTLIGSSYVRDGQIVLGAKDPSNNAA
ncbi:MAG TPA: response regulator [Kofleriaceae bacterium]|nr:response regulator [Kofleriaceae bacterium]